MSDKINGERIALLYTNVILQAFKDAIRPVKHDSIIHKNGKRYLTTQSDSYPNQNDQNNARTWLLYDATGDFQEVHDLAGLDASITRKIAIQCKKDKWPNVLPALKKQITKQNAIDNKNRQRLERIY
jgi:hypothetical protein